jgi:hypothetical protein
VQQQTFATNTKAFPRIPQIWSPLSRIIPEKLIVAQPRYYLPCMELVQLQYLKYPTAGPYTEVIGSSTRTFTVRLFRLLVSADRKAVPALQQNFLWTCYKSSDIGRNVSPRQHNVVRIKCSWFHSVFVLGGFKLLFFIIIGAATLFRAVLWKINQQNILSITHIYRWAVLQAWRSDFQSPSLCFLNQFCNVASGISGENVKL